MAVCPAGRRCGFTKIAKKAGLGPEVARLLFERGIQNQESLKKFLEPSLEDLHDPYLLHDMDKAVETDSSGH